ncbi:10000_t:CDS:2 [Ambispora gerdemannii]|uniref:10000_t:CDS:1 n=1 Tax=Ambispora gerdemannii TaxID=144530 RepID=A0A9N9DB85_9GLOM|nr:10000_t:CDS:2 [Ambispora gerdemannii]
MTFAKQEYLLVTLVMICWFGRSLTSSKQEHLWKTPAVSRFWKEVTKKEQSIRLIRASQHIRKNGKLTKYAYEQEVLTEGIKLPTTHKRVNEIEGNISTRKKRKSSSEFLPSSDENTKELDEDDEEIKFDLASISMGLQREPTYKWEVGYINNRYYQKEVIKEVERGALSWCLLVMSVSYVYKTRMEENNKHQSLHFKRTITFA